MNILIYRTDNKSLLTLEGSTKKSFKTADYFSGSIPDTFKYVTFIMNSNDLDLRIVLKVVT